MAAARKGPPSASPTWRWLARSIEEPLAEHVAEIDRKRQPEPRASRLAETLAELRACACGEATTPGGRNGDGGAVRDEPGHIVRGKILVAWRSVLSGGRSCLRKRTERRRRAHRRGTAPDAPPSWRGGAGRTGKTISIGLKALPPLSFGRPFSSGRSMTEPFFRGKRFLSGNPAGKVLPSVMEKFPRRLDRRGQQRGNKGGVMNRFGLSRRASLKLAGRHWELFCSRPSSAGSPMPRAPIRS